ncbi:MAG: ATPase domain-containing protein [Halapricum sp.]
MRAESGVPGFDLLLKGGLPANGLYLLSGPPGAGKTTFAAQFITQCVQNEENGLYLTMHESEDALKESMAGYSFEFSRVLESGPVLFLNVVETQTEFLLTQEVEGNYLTSAQNQIRRVQNFLAEHDIDRLVIDSTMLLKYFFSDHSEAFFQFLTGLKQADTTTLVISETTDPSSYADEHFLADGVIFLHNFYDHDSGSMQRGLQIIKMRGTAIDTDIHKLSFTDAGLRVHPDKQVQR